MILSRIFCRFDVRAALLIAGFLLVFAGYAGAQEAAAGPDPSAVPPAEAVQAPPAELPATPPPPAAQATGGGQPADVLASTDPAVLSPNDIPSVLFTFWEHTAIKDARRSRGLVRAPTEAELTKDLRERQEELMVKPPPEERELFLSGISYVGDKDWTIWLNGKRVTPSALPKEAIDLKVYNDYIELKWFDEYTNQVFPIRLRPHQRFNIDTRIFLPG